MQKFAHEKIVLQERIQSLKAELHKMNIDVDINAFVYQPDNDNDSNSTSTATGTSFVAVLYYQDITFDSF